MSITPSIQQTLCIIKPHIKDEETIHQIDEIIKKNGLKIIASKVFQFNKETAKEFYKEHKNKPFFNDLVNNLTADICYPRILQGENAIQKYRDLIGDKDPKKANKGTLRAMFGEDTDFNAVHGSDSEQSAKQEISTVFSKIDLLGILL
jgi:nucleoside-diphosphate kinase